MSPKQAAEKLAAELDVELSAGGGRHFEVAAESPRGFVFAGTGTHGTVSEAEAGKPAADAWRGILADLRGGLSPCKDPDCEICKPEAGGGGE